MSIALGRRVQAMCVGHISSEASDPPPNHFTDAPNTRLGTLRQYGHRHSTGPAQSDAVDLTGVGGGFHGLHLGSLHCRRRAASQALLQQIGELPPSLPPSLASLGFGGDAAAQGNSLVTGKQLNKYCANPFARLHV
jgi:hypothetical protein